MGVGEGRLTRKESGVFSSSHSVKARNERRRCEGMRRREGRIGERAGGHGAVREWPRTRMETRRKGTEVVGAVEGKAALLWKKNLPLLQAKEGERRTRIRRQPRLSWTLTLWKLGQEGDTVRSASSPPLSWLCSSLEPPEPVSSSQSTTS